MTENGNFIINFLSKEKCLDVKQSFQIMNWKNNVMEIIIWVYI